MINPGFTEFGRVVAPESWSSLSFIQFSHNLMGWGRFIQIFLLCKCSIL